ncbi:MAG: CdaR family protein [Desulfosalsimonas sp.]|uniref:CdaR family protein n=1 Tax=Desulfosalsimonas sp. TaxID=3073848 RepID=UPI003970B37B
MKAYRHPQPGRQFRPAALGFMILAACMPVFSQNAFSSAPEEAINATIAVEARYSGTPAFGYEVAEAGVFPEHVEVTGPESRIREISAVQTHSLDITGATETIEKKVPLDLPEDIETTSSGDNGQIRIRVVIEKQKVEKTIRDIPVELVHDAHPSIVRPATVTITLSGNRLFFANEFSAKDIDVWMNLKGMGPGLHVLPVEIRLPEKTDLLRVEPQVFTVQILPQTSNTSENNHAAGT